MLQTAIAAPGQHLCFFMLGRTSPRNDFTDGPVATRADIICTKAAVAGAG